MITFWCDICVIRFAFTLTNESAAVKAVVDWLYSKQKFLLQIECTSQQSAPATEVNHTQRRTITMPLKIGNCCQGEVELITGPCVMCYRSTNQARVRSTCIRNFSPGNSAWIIHWSNVCTMYVKCSLATDAVLGGTWQSLDKAVVEWPGGATCISGWISSA